MINSINHPWGISQKMKDRMGSTWADMDFEINDRLSTHNMKENLMDQSVGNLYISNIYIKMKYKDLLTINKQLKKHVNHSYNSDIEQKFPVDIKSHTLLLNKKEIQRLEETIHITISSLLKKYQLGLYL